MTKLSNIKDKLRQVRNLSNVNSVRTLASQISEVGLKLSTNISDYVNKEAKLQDSSDDGLPVEIDKVCFTAIVKQVGGTFERRLDLIPDLDVDIEVLVENANSQGLILDKNTVFDIIKSVINDIKV